MNINQEKEQLNVLIVDDEASVAELIAYVLKKTLHKVRTATSVPAALEMMRETPADILITDIQMPEMSGLELTETVLQAYPDTVAIGVTGYGNIKIAVDFMKLGGSDFLEKPIKKDVVRLAVDSAAEKFRLKRELLQANEELKQKNIVLQKEIKARLESDERNKKLFETHSAIMLVLDPNTGDIVNANSAACAYYGYAKDKITCLKVTDIDILPQKEIFQKMEQARSQKKNFFCMQHRLADGRIQDVEVISVPMKEQGRKLLYSTIRDVSRQNRAEKALKASEKRYREVFENAPSGIYQATLEGKLIKVNPAMVRIFGYTSPDEMVSDVTDIATQLYAESDHREQVLGRILGCDGWITVQTEMLRKDKTIIIVKARVRAVRNRDNAPLYLEGFVEDITEKEEQKRTFELEMSRAKDIYDLLLEPHLPVMPEVGIHVRCIPADKIGGDVLEISRADENKLLIFLADVTGHGIPAAMTANTLKMLFREISETETHPAVICGHLNRTMYKTILPDDMVAAFCGLIDLDALTLTYYLSGLPAPLIIRNHESLRLKSTGLPIGVFEDLIAECRNFRFEKGDVIAAFTDGVIEIKSQNGDIYGNKNLEKGIIKTEQNAYTVVETIINNASLFQQEDRFRDDVIVLGIRFSAPREKRFYLKPISIFCTPGKSLFKTKTKDIRIDDMIRFIMRHIAENIQTDSDILGKVKIALSEMLTNAVEHGSLEMTDLKKSDVFESEEYREVFQARKNSDKYGERLIRIECLYDKTQLEISVEDDGEGFDMNSIPDPIYEKNLTASSGRGIFLAKMNVEKLTYNRKGNKAVLMFRIGN